MSGMVYPVITAYQQTGTKGETSDAFFHRLADALELAGATPPEENYSFSLDLTIRDDELFYDQAVLRREFFDIYLKQMELILPALMTYIVFIKGGSEDEITMSISEDEGELNITNLRFSGRDDEHRKDYELLIGMIYTQAMIAKHNEYKWSGQKIDTYPRVSSSVLAGTSTVIVEVGQSIPFFGTTPRPTPVL